MQGLQELWGFNRVDYSWATAGYLGAIESGCTTCGLLIGSSVALGLRFGQGKSTIPFEDKDGRDKAVKAVKEFYLDFLKEFNSTDCQTLTSCDFSKEEDAKRYMDEKIYKDKCFKYFNFVMNRFIGREANS